MASCFFTRYSRKYGKFVEILQDDNTKDVKKGLNYV